MPDCPAASRSRSGFALLAVLIALALLSTVGIAITAMGAIQYRTALNHRSAVQALLLADAGATHALALMRGSLSVHEYSDILQGDDASFGTADDGVLAGFSLADSDALPDTGVLTADGRYYVQVVNDEDDPSGDPAVDSNHRLVALCRGETEDGGVAEVRAVLAALAFPAIVTNGDLTMPGVPSVLGPCGSVHANGDLHINGSPTINGTATASGTVYLTGTITDEAGYEVIPSSDEPYIEVPDYGALEYCGAAEYALKDGWAIAVGLPRDSTFIGNGNVMGWKWDGANLYSLSGNQAEDGIYCVYGNVKITGNAGSAGDPLLITLFATGSVNIGGNPRIAAAPASSDIVVIAEGDLDISGNASATTPAYSGMLYAGSQCRMNGNPSVAGHVLCYDAPDPAGAIDLIDENRVNGNPDLTYDCSGQRQETAIVSWWEARAQ